MSYWIYENWRANGHTARLHDAICPHCKNGKGNHPGSGDENGAWHGPFDTVEAAEYVGNGLGATVSRCKFCRP
jgi:hypothetical protein